LALIYFPVLSIVNATVLTSLLIYLHRFHCCLMFKGAGGFYSDGASDSDSPAFPGAYGFRSGGAGAVVPSGNEGTHSVGGFGGGGTANFVSTVSLFFRKIISVAS
jgi:hypothetical protein